MKNLFRLLVITLILSCAPPDEERFNRSGVSFTVPSGWKITEEEDLDGKGYYLSCEKEGANSSGLVTVSWVNDTVDLVTVANHFASELKKNFILKHANPKLEPVSKTTFNGMPAKGFGYSLKLMSVAHEGHVYCFYGDHKTITVMVQEALEDKEVNRPGIQKITSSFSAD